MCRRLVEIVLLLAISAIVLHTWLVQGLFRPQRIAGPSMANFLHGPHRPLRCSDCNWDFAVAESLRHATGQATCPLCGHDQNDITRIAPIPGERIWIDRTAFFFRQPERWQPIVFRCAENPREACIKRVVGLPGERIELRFGDIYVDGEIARKPIDVARSFNLVVHDSRFFAADDSVESSDNLPGWSATSESGQEVTAEAGEIDAANWLYFQHADMLTDNYETNQSVSRSLHRVRDVMATAVVQVDALQVNSQDQRATDAPYESETALWLRIDRDGAAFFIRLSYELREAGRAERWQAVLSSGSQSGDEPLLVGTYNANRSAKTLSNGKAPITATVEWGIIDQRLFVIVGGETILQYDLNKLPSAEGQELAAVVLNQNTALRPSPLAIATVRSRSRIDSIRVWRDVYYMKAPVGYSPALAADAYEVSDGSYFVLGDNSPISVDSRLEPPGMVAADAILGRPLFAR